MTPSEVRAAAEQFAQMDVAQFCNEGESAWRMRMLILFAKHILATVPADGDDAITAGPEILPCPFCGGDPFVSESDDGTPRWISCLRCESDGPTIGYRFDGTADEARQIVVKAWNQRST